MVLCSFRGAFGLVVLAESQKDGSKYAVKIISKKGEEVVRIDAALQVGQRRIHVLCRPGRHEIIAQTTSVGGTRCVGLDDPSSYQCFHKWPQVCVSKREQSDRKSKRR